MFTQSKKGSSKQVKKETLKDYAVTILTSGCHFTGKLYCKGSTRIGGKVDGEIVSEGLLILEQEAVVSADIEADEIVVQGQVEGTIRAHSRVELTSSCTFAGDVATPSLVIEEGARFNGKSTMGELVKLRSGGDKPSSKAVIHEDEPSSKLALEERERVDGLAMRMPELNARS